MDVSMVVNGSLGNGFTWQGGETVDRFTRGRVEAVFGPENYKNVWWMELALEASRHVARVKMPAGSATGFMVSPDVFMTNNHVFEDKQDAKRATLQFNYRLDADDEPMKRDEWKCDPDALFRTNKELDYTIVKVKPKSNKTAGDTWGWFNLDHGVEVFEESRVNIIQHPQGRHQQIAFRDNQVKFVDGTMLQYITDTDYGTSGSPVLDDRFNVVALHSQRVPDPADPNVWYRNQGFAVDALLAEIGDVLA